MKIKVLKFNSAMRLARPDCSFAQDEIHATIYISVPRLFRPSLAFLKTISWLMFAIIYCWRTPKLNHMINLTGDGNTSDKYILTGGTGTNLN